MTSSVTEPIPSTTEVVVESKKEFVGKSPFQIALVRLRHDKIAMVCFGIVLFYAIIAIFAGLIAKLLGVSLETVRVSEVLNLATLLPKSGPPNHGFDPNHPLGIAPGTGADNLAVWLYGARTSLSLASLATVLATTIGVVLGLVAGFLGGIVDTIISFLTDVFLTFPFILAALSVAPIISDRFGTEPEKLEAWSFYSLILVLVFFGWMGTTRLIRGEVIALREREFVQAARVIGVPTWQILVKEILPNLVAPIVVTISLGLPAFVAAEAGLSYLGIGVVGRESWGVTIDQATPWWEQYPLYLVEPVLGIMILVLALNLLGDAIRDALDPKTRR